MQLPTWSSSFCLNSYLSGRRLGLCSGCFGGIFRISATGRLFLDRKWDLTTWRKLRKRDCLIIKRSDQGKWNVVKKQNSLGREGTPAIVSRYEKDIEWEEAKFYIRPHRMQSAACVHAALPMDVIPFIHPSDRNRYYSPFIHTQTSGNFQLV